MLTYAPPPHSSPLPLEQLVGLLTSTEFHSHVHCQDPERESASMTTEN